MNINTQDILNKLLYNNLSQNAEIENNNTVNENLENINSKIFKYSQNNSHILSSDEELKLLLNSLNQAPTKENIELIKILVQNNLPINKDNLDSIIKSTKIFNENSIEKALFLIENKLKPTINIGEQIDNYLSKETLIDKQIDTLFSNINSLGDNNLTKEIFKNSNLESLLNININKLTDFKLELLNHIKTNLSEYKSLETLLNGITNLDKNSTNSNYNKLSNILENILDFNFNEDLSINFEKTNILKNIANTLNENINNQDLLKDNLKNLNNLFEKNNLLNKDTLNLLQKEIFSIIKSSPKINTKFKDVINNFDTFNNKLKFFDFENSSNEDLNDFFEDLHIISKNIKDNINNYNDSNKENIINNLDNLNKNIDFMNNLKSTVFLQIPLNINNFSTTAELIVFSNKKNKNTASKNNSGSALLSLNLLYLGKLEVFINKINNDISCQFRLENDNTQFLVKDNIDLLSNYLINKNLNLKDVTFKSLDESFSLVNITPKKKSNLDFKLSNFNVKA